MEEEEEGRKMQPAARMQILGKSAAGCRTEIVFPFSASLSNSISLLKKFILQKRHQNAIYFLVFFFWVNVVLNWVFEILVVVLFSECVVVF